MSPKYENLINLTSLNLININVFLFSGYGSVSLFYVSGMTEFRMSNRRGVVAQNSDMDFKEGNEYFSRSHLKAAIRCYDKAIVSKIKIIIVIKCRSRKL